MKEYTFLYIVSVTCASTDENLYIIKHLYEAHLILSFYNTPFSVTLQNVFVYSL